MFIKRIDSFDNYSGEADLIVSDGTYELLCYCGLFQNESEMMPNLKIIESFLCENIIRVENKEYLIIKQKEYYSYHLQGKVLDADNHIVCIRNIIIKLDAPIPRDIRNQEFIGFDVVRLDCYIECNTKVELL